MSPEERKLFLSVLIWAVDAYDWFSSTVEATAVERAALLSNRMRLKREPILFQIRKLTLVEIDLSGSR